MANPEFPATSRIGGMPPYHRDVLQTMHLPLLDTLQENGRLDSLYKHPKLEQLLTSRSPLLVRYILHVLLKCSFGGLSAIDYSPF